jgi:hypothetical protein
MRALSPLRRRGRFLRTNLIDRFLSSPRKTSFYLRTGFLEDPPLASPGFFPEHQGFFQATDIYHSGDNRVYMSFPLGSALILHS